MTRILTSLLLAIAISVSGTAASCHEVRPAFLEIVQATPSSYEVTWKQPTMGEVAVHLVPHLSGGWLDADPDDQYLTGGFLVRHWSVKDAPPDALTGAVISIEGLDDTMTETFVRIRRADGKIQQDILRPESPTLRISDAETASVFSFFGSGIRHILNGPDHLVFVLGLLLLARGARALIGTVSAFTLAHSITLAFAALGMISTSAPFLNLLIALSILFLGCELLRARRGGTSLAAAHPWIPAFAFGLLHGMGFAGGLQDLGLRQHGLLASLLLFNLGVEAGQLCFVALVLAVGRAFRLLEFRGPAVELIPDYLVGTLGAWWVLRSGALVLAGG